MSIESQLQDFFYQLSFSLWSDDKKRKGANCVCFHGNLRKVSLSEISRLFWTRAYPENSIDLQFEENQTVGLFTKDRSSKFVQ